MAAKLLCDTGPLAGFFDRNDSHHAWARKHFAMLYQPLFTCEAVISELCFLLQSVRLSVDPVAEAIEREQIVVDFAADKHWRDLRRLMNKYADQPMSFADACLVRMTEVSADCQLLTTDRDFKVYRRFHRQVIPLISPF
jgi:uncharacterized protein